MHELISGHSLHGDHWVLSGDLLELANAVDSYVLKLAREFSPESFMFPGFIDAKYLKKIDYLHSFPQHATFITTLEDNDQNLHDFRNQGIFDGDSIALTKTSPVQKLLTPATCYHCYINQANKSFDTPFYMTAKCTCYRREKEYVPLERQWNFTMREVVCIGTYEETQYFVDRMMQGLSQFVRTSGLNAKWEQAQDVFFDPANNPKSLMQKIHPNKFELVFDGRLAICSANVHRNYFGEAFNIRRGEELASTACVAFGIERWLAAIANQFGAEKEKWPEILLGEEELLYE